MTGVSQAVKTLEVLLNSAVAAGCFSVKAVLDTSVMPILLSQEAEVTNAGTGSNLTLEGSVEADASIMLGDKTFAAVGAAPGLHRALVACLYSKAAMHCTWHTSCSLVVMQAKTGFDDAA